MAGGQPKNPCSPLLSGITTSHDPSPAPAPPSFLFSASREPPPEDSHQTTADPPLSPRHCPIVPNDEDNHRRPCFSSSFPSPATPQPLNPSPPPKQPLTHFSSEQRTRPTERQPCNRQKSHLPHSSSVPGEICETPFEPVKRHYLELLDIHGLRSGALEIIEAISVKSKSIGFEIQEYETMRELTYTQ